MYWLCGKKCVWSNVFEVGDTTWVGVLQRVRESSENFTVPGEMSLCVWLCSYPTTGRWENVLTSVGGFLWNLDYTYIAVHTHCASVHQAAKLVASLLRIAGVTAGLAESIGSLPPGLWLASPAGWLPRTGISSGTLHSVIEYGQRRVDKT